MKNVIALCSLAVSACATLTTGPEPEPYIGQDIREVAITYGPPSNAFDYSDGWRVFQWAPGAGASPEWDAEASTSESVWMTTNTRITSTESISQTDVCSYVAEWDETANGWIVREVRTPPGMGDACR